LNKLNSKLIEQASQRIHQIRQENGLSSDTPIPADLVLASASGLDPHLSVESAMLQVRRVAKARALPESELSTMVLHYLERPWLGVWGKQRVNVLKLNLAIDQLQKKKVS
jgi:potassium-transporting ATPase KdpC subunit